MGIFGSDITTTNLLSVKASVILNPIAKEKMKNIRKWVAQNSIANPIDPNSGRAIKNVHSTGDSLFNKIFEQFSSGSALAGTWQVSEASNEFYFSELAYAK